jgi:hypothetical protein
MIAFMVDKDLGLILQPAKGGAVQNPVAIPLKNAPKRAFFLGKPPPARARRMAGAGAKTADILMFRLGSLV